MAQRFDFDVEAVDAHGVILSRREAIKDAATNRELAALGDLGNALVAGRYELQRDLIQVDQISFAEREAARPQLRVRNLLRQCDRRDDHNRRLALGWIKECVERRYAQPDEVWWWGQVRFVGNASAGVETDRPRRQPNRKIGCQRLRFAVISSDNDARLNGAVLKQSCDRVRPQRA